MALNKDRVADILLEKAFELDKEVEDTLTNNKDALLSNAVHTGALVELKSLLIGIKQYPDAQREEIVQVIEMRIEHLE